MSINVRLEVFEGPLDLLLHLIEKNKINIYDVSIASITDQYLEYVQELAYYNMDIASEFLVVASTLLKIKSKLLLPKEEKEDKKDDLEEELIQRLIEYKRFKYLSKQLGMLYTNREVHFYGAERIPLNVSVYREKAEVVEIAKKSHFSGKTLYTQYVNLIKRNLYKIDRVRGEFNGRITAEPVDIRKRLDEIKRLMSINNRLNFKDLMPDKPSKTTEIVTFLIVLEMMKSGAIEVDQKKQFGEIDITVNCTPDDYGVIADYEDIDNG